MAYSLLPADQVSPNSTCSTGSTGSSSGPHDPTAGISSSTGPPSGVLSDRRRPGQAHLEQGGLVSSSTKGLLEGGAGGKAGWRHSSSWQDVDDDVANAADNVYEEEDSASSRTALLYRPQHHVTVTVSNKGMLAFIEAVCGAGGCWRCAGLQ